MMILFLIVTVGHIPVFAEEQDGSDLLRGDSAAGRHGSSGPSLLRLSTGGESVRWARTTKASAAF